MRWRSERGVPRSDDLRQLVVEREPTHLLLVSMAGLGVQDVVEAVRRKVRVLCVEPPAQTLAEWWQLQEAMPRGGGRWIMSLPKLTEGEAYRRWQRVREREREVAAAAAADEGKAADRATGRVIRVTDHGQPGSGFAALLDAWHTVITMAEMPEAIDATGRGRGRGGGAGSCPSGCGN